MTDWEIFTQVIIPAMVGGAGGLAGSVLGWSIEKRRARLLRRAALVDIWRKELLADLDSTMRLGGANPRFAFMALPAYASLRSHLSEDLLDIFEGKVVMAVNGGDFPRRQLMDEIGEIEKKWGLV
jgi:hypothetical protein